MRRNLWITAVVGPAFLAGLAVGLAGVPDRTQSPSEDPEPPPSARLGPAVPGDAAPEAPAAGKWSRARSPVGVHAGSELWEAPEAAEALLATPYLQGYRPAGDRAGLVRAPRPAAVQPGLNLYTSGHAPEAVLMAADGTSVHRWAYPLKRFRPELYAGGRDEEVRRLEYFRRARLLPNGDLLGIYEGLGLVKLSPRSELIWGYAGGAHHDLDVAPDGTIWVLDREGKLLPRIDPDRAVLEDFVTVLSPDGEVLRKISILEAFERSDYASLLEWMPDRPDILHTNTLEILDGRLADRSPAFAEGHLLLSVLELDTVAVLDPSSETIVWALAGLWRKQHQPTVLDNGHLLVFDNLGAGPRRSRVLEIDPFTQRIAWRFGRELFSKTLGSSQRLANGNTLITESENGRALEVSPGGEVVWEFLTPHRVPQGKNGEELELVAVLFEVERLPPDFPFRGLGGDAPSGLERLGR